MTLDEIEARLIVMVSESYDITIDGGDSFASVLGLDSLEIAGFVLDLEAEWPVIEEKISFDNEVLSGTVHELAKTIHRFVGGPPC